MCQKFLFIPSMLLIVIGTCEIAGCDNSSPVDNMPVDGAESDDDANTDDTASSPDSTFDSADSTETEWTETETTTDTDTETELRGCYSPIQNLDIAFDENAQGCRCDQEVYNFETVCIDDVPLFCDNGHWAVATDSPCVPPPYDCFSPEYPESVSIVTEGCDCDPAVDAPVCDGKAFVCSDGKWITVIGGPCMEKK